MKTAGMISSQALAVPKGTFALEHQLFRLERAICILALAVMLATVFISVVIRYFNLPLRNVAEWATVAMAPMTFVGAAMCSYTQAHIAVDVVKLIPSTGIRRGVRGVVAIVMLVFSGVYAWLGWFFFTDVLQSGEKLLDMGTPLAVPVFFLVAGMVLMVLHGAMELWRVLTNQPPVKEEML